jgi:hypothetical protein
VVNNFKKLARAVRDPLGHSSTEQKHITNPHVGFVFIIALNPQMDLKSVRCTELVD